MLGRTLEALFPRAGDEPYTQMVRDAAAGGAARGDRFDAALERWFEDHVHLVPEGVLVLSRDVTLERDTDRRSRAEVAARAEAEDALRHSRDVLSLAMRGGAMGAWSRDIDTNTVWWSPELEHIVGLEAGVFSQTEDAFFELVHDDDKAAVRRAVGQAIETGTDYIVDFRFRHASGEWRWMEGRGRAIYGDDGRPRSVYGIGIDVTGRKRTEAALEAARDAAESANRLKDQFLANLSHELRTPLNAILGYARLMQTDVIPPEKWRQAISVIERNAVAQNQLVEDLLDMSRITTGTVHLDAAPIQVAPVIRQALDAVGPAAEAKRIDIALDLDPFAGSVTADATRLQQVLWNLLNNAVKFTRLGGRVTVRLARTARVVEIAITDTGIGIAPEFLPHVFTPFRQADARFGRQYGGLGLGLAICRQLVELQGGTIEATSPGTGEGATFVVRLPACEGAEAAAGTDERSSGPILEPAGVGHARAWAVRRRRPARRRRGRHADALQDDARIAGRPRAPGGDGRRGARRSRMNGVRACWSATSACPASTATRCCGPSAPRPRIAPSPPSRSPPTPGRTIALASSRRASTRTCRSRSIPPSSCGRWWRRWPHRGS